MSETTKVLRKGHMQTINTKDLQHGDIQFHTQDTEREHDSAVKEAPLPGTKRVQVIAIGPYTQHALKFKGTMIRVPQWVVMEDGRALKFNRLFNKNGTADLDPGEFVFPGGAVFRPCTKTPLMESAERESRTALYAAKAGIFTADAPVLH